MRRIIYILNLILIINLISDAQVMRRRVSGTAFNMLDVANLDVWLRADQQVYQENTYSTLADDDGEVVGGWKNLQSDARHFTEATNKCTLKIVGGKKYVRADGSNDKLTGSMTAGAAKSVFIYGRNLAVEANSKTIVSSGTAPNAQYFTNTGYLTPANALKYYDTSPTGGISFGGDATTLTLWSIVYTSASVCSVWVNGTFAVTFDPHNQYSTDTRVSLFYYMNNVTPIQFANAEIKELVIVNAAVDATTRAAIETDIMSR